MKEEIIENLLELFGQSIGYEFRLKGTPLTDVITGIDFKNQMVKGKHYGDFHIDLCELTGNKKPQP